MNSSDQIEVNAIKKMLDQSAGAYAERDWEGFTSHFTQDAVWMPPNQPPLVGKKAWWHWIGGKWDKSTRIEMQSNHEEIVVAGDWAYEWHTESQAGDGWQRNFKGVFIMHRQMDGAWKIARYCFNSSPVTVD